MLVYPRTTTLEVYFAIVPAVDMDGKTTFAALHMDDSDRSPRSHWQEFNPNGDPTNYYYAMGPSGPGEQYLRRYLNHNDMGKYASLYRLKSVDLSKGKIFKTLRTVVTTFETELIDNA